MEEGLINTSYATPRWVARAVAAGDFIGLRPGHNAHRFYFVALVQFVLSAAALWALSMGAVEAGHQLAEERPLRLESLIEAAQLTALLDVGQ